MSFRANRWSVGLSFQDVCELPGDRVSAGIDALGFINERPSALDGALEFGKQLIHFIGC